MIIVCALATMIYCNSVAVFASTPDAGDSSDQVTQTQADVELEKHVTCGSTIKLTLADEGETTFARDWIWIWLWTTISHWIPGIERPWGILANIWDCRRALRARGRHQRRTDYSLATREYEEMVTFAFGA